MTPDDLGELDVNLSRQHRCAAGGDHGAFYLADEEFHRIISTIATSRRVWKTIHVAKGQLDRVRRLAFPLPDHMSVVLAEHAAIYEGLKANDPQAATSAMERHLGRVFDILRTLIGQRPELFSGQSVRVVDAYARLLKTP